MSTGNMKGAGVPVKALQPAGGENAGAGIQKVDPPVWSMEVGDFYDPLFLIERRTITEERVEGDKKVRIFRTTWVYAREDDIAPRPIKGPRPM